MDRYLIGTPATVSCPFTSGDTVVDPGTVTVTITREDGTVLVTAGATGGSGAVARTFPLTTTHTAALDLLRLDWTSATLGTLTTYAEIVGGFLFSLAEARALSALSSTTTYPAATVVAARTLAEVALEDACGVAFVPRYARETRSGRGTCDIVPQHPRPLSIQSVTLNGTTITDALIDAEDGPAAATFYRQAGWSSYARRNVVIKYTHGYPYPPPRVGRACLLLAKRWLVDTPVSDRATSLQNPDGTLQYLVTAGVRNAVTDIPECNAVIDEYGVRGNSA